jgi:hypothetical protein
VIAAWVAACSAPAPPPGPAAIADPDPGTVDVVVYLVGDAGDHPRESAPLLHRLRADVEEWSERLARDAAVSVLFLGDNVYPEGVRARDDRAFAADSSRLHAQVWTVEGPAARRHASRALFFAGNHDWGNARAPEGLERLRNEEAQLQAHAAGGSAAALVPRAGDPGPVVVDLGAHARVVALDTHWWLQSEDDARRATTVDSLAAVLRSAGARHVIVAAHHPLVSAGPHARRSPLDPLWILHEVGALAQDLNAEPYRALIRALGRAFAAGGAPLIYAAGHDHSLQVLRGSGTDQPTWTLVSGAGSKLSAVRRANELAWASPEPGYMRVVVDARGGVTVFVESAPEELIRCERAGRERESCVARGAGAFRTTHSMRLR